MEQVAGAKEDHHELECHQLNGPLYDLVLVMTVPRGGNKMEFFRVPCVVFPKDIVYLHLLGEFPRPQCEDIS